MAELAMRACCLSPRFKSSFPARTIEPIGQERVDRPAAGMLYQSSHRMMYGRQDTSNTAPQERLSNSEQGNRSRQQKKNSNFGVPLKVCHLISGFTPNISFIFRGRGSGVPSSVKKKQILGEKMDRLFQTISHCFALNMITHSFSGLSRERSIAPMVL